MPWYYSIHMLDRSVRVVGPFSTKQEAEKFKKTQDEIDRKYGDEHRCYLWPQHHEPPCPLYSTDVFEDVPLWYPSNSRRIDPSEGHILWNSTGYTSLGGFTG